MKRFIILFLMMNSHAISWSMNNASHGEYQYSEFEGRSFFGKSEKVHVVLSYSVKKNPNKNNLLFRVHSKKSYSDGAISNRSFEWEEPGIISEGLPDTNHQWRAVKHKLERTKNIDHKQKLQTVLDKLLFPQMPGYMSREDMFIVLGYGRDDKPRQPLR